MQNLFGSALLKLIEKHASKAFSKLPVTTFHRWQFGANRFYHKLCMTEFDHISQINSLLKMLYHILINYTQGFQDGIKCYLLKALGASQFWPQYCTPMAFLNLMRQALFLFLTNTSQIPFYIQMPIYFVSW